MIKLEIRRSVLIKLFVFSMILIGVQSEVWGQPAEPLTPADFQIFTCNGIGRFYLDQAVSEVTDALGAGFEDRTIDETPGYGAFVHRDYGAILFGYSTIEKQVSVIRVVGPGFETRRGVRIGDSLETVLKRYGREAVFPGTIQYSIPIPDDHLRGEYLLTFELSEDDRVATIWINKGN